MLLADRPTTSRWAPFAGERFYQVRPILEGKNRGRHFVRKTPLPGSQIAIESDLGSAFEPNASRRPRRQRNSTPRSQSSQTSVQPSSLTRAVARADSAIQHRDRNPLEATVRRGCRESSKRSSASVGAGAPFRGKAQAGAGAVGVLDRRQRTRAARHGSRRKAIVGAAIGGLPRLRDCGGRNPSMS